MPKKQVYTTSRDEKVAAFAKAFYKELNADAWGAIDPFLFDEIADIRNAEDLSDDANGLRAVIEKVMTKYKLLTAEDE